MAFASRISNKTMKRAVANKSEMEWVLEKDRLMMQLRMLVIRSSLKNRLWEIRTKKKIRIKMLKIRKKTILKWKMTLTVICTPRKSSLRAKAARKASLRKLTRKWEKWIKNRKKKI